MNRSKSRRRAGLLSAGADSLHVAWGRSPRRPARLAFDRHAAEHPADVVHRPLDITTCDRPEVHCRFGLPAILRERSGHDTAIADTRCSAYGFLA